MSPIRLIVDPPPPTILYDFNNWEIGFHGKKVLKRRIIPFLKDNPNVIIEIGSHTDARGSAPYNLKLSRLRAKAVADYIIAQGKINPKRLKPKGYGESELKIRNAKTEEEHQTNRRTTFKIVGFIKK